MRRYCWLPLALLLAGVACTIALSLPASSSAQPIGSIPGLQVWPTTDLFNIACPSAGSCSTVGTFESTNVDRALTISLSGDSWRQSELFDPKSAADYQSLADVSCSMADECIALEPSSPLLATENDGKWAVARPLRFAQYDVLANTTACSPHGLCWAVNEVFGKASRSAISSSLHCHSSRTTLTASGTTHSTHNQTRSEPFAPTVSLVRRALSWTADTVNCKVGAGFRVDPA
jgi:hypothetical protein